jgi:hypothetical protein
MTSCVLNLIVPVFVQRCEQRMGEAVLRLGILVEEVPQKTIRSRALHPHALATSDATEFWLA